MGRGSVSVLDHTSVIGSSDGTELNPSRAEELIKAIGNAMADAGLRLEELDQIAVSTGPGSYSGIRIGIATALGLKHSLDIPCIGVVTLDAMALSARHITNIVPAIPVGKRDVAYQLFKIRDEKPNAAGTPKLISEMDFVGRSIEFRDFTLFAHSDLVTRLKSYDITNIRIADAGANLAGIIGFAAASGDGSEVFDPVYLRNSSSLINSAGFEV